jgi:hypothetical protein
VTRRPAERGAASIELLGLLPLMLLAALAAAQLLIATATATEATNAARTGSRVASRGGDAKEAAVEALSPWLRDGADVEVAGTRTVVRVEIPILLPALRIDALAVRRTAEIPRG